MTIAIPIQEGDDLDAQIDTRFSKCDRALIVEIDDEQLGGLRVLALSSRGDRSAFVDQLIAHGIDAAVFGYLPLSHLDRLNESGVRVHLLASGSVREALCSIFSGRLYDRAGQNLCTRYLDDTDEIWGDEPFSLAEADRPSLALSVEPAPVLTALSAV